MSFLRPDIGKALKSALTDKRKNTKNTRDERINGKKVVLETVVTLRSKEEGKPSQKFTEYVLEDGTTV